MSRPKHPLEIRAKAIELLHEGLTLTEAAAKLKCSVPAVSRWYMEYLGYRGREGFSITLQSKNWDIVDIDDF
ncbi:helix-turn-helix domain-containing protein [Sphingobacterium griseoflavum]|uniref:Transposase n=1 Tax=Sphingobacterium griseoflavum TaxID=1474952 RepID=A0ABQ3HU78_9SPHI|nr:helix-turn-helix domain-containing protein [Sphingobacterium griseoflavum]GHE35039.1 hypothetical protein GCM10017764_17810 [Sphingobacterium griseoflavum]